MGGALGRELSFPELIEGVIALLDTSARLDRDRCSCLVLLPHSYTGRGPAESCVKILEAFPDFGVEATLFILRARKPINLNVKVVEAAGPILRRMPFRYMRKLAQLKLFRAFAKAIDRAAPRTIVWFWPDSPIELVRRAKARGLITVREMINSPLAHAKPILDAAYASRGLAAGHGISDFDVAKENEELSLYDRIFASNDEVELALNSLKIESFRILSSSFGWDRSRFDGPSMSDSVESQRVRACFVGLMNVRKGLPDLLDAWRVAGLDGELVLAGSVEACLVPMLEEAKSSGSVTYMGHVNDVANLYRNCDMFVFPTHEEGGPQVTYEAAACGLPVITTAMGAARLVKDMETGLIVEPGNVSELVEALRIMATNTSLRKALGVAAKVAADRFEYRMVGKVRAEQLNNLLRSCEQTH